MSEKDSYEPRSEHPEALAEIIADEVKKLIGNDPEVSVALRTAYLGLTEIDQMKLVRLAKKGSDLEELDEKIRLGLSELVEWLAGGNSIGPNVHVVTLGHESVTRDPETAEEMDAKMLDEAMPPGALFDSCVLHFNRRGFRIGPEDPVIVAADKGEYSGLSNSEYKIRCILDAISDAVTRAGSARSELLQFVEWAKTELTPEELETLSKKMGE